jgi:hypothetical protein
MFMLHCILVATLKGVENEEELSEKELIQECRQEALNATEQYRDHVFDWRKENADIWGVCCS